MLSYLAWHAPVPAEKNTIASVILFLYTTSIYKELILSNWHFRHNMSKYFAIITVVPKEAKARCHANTQTGWQPIVSVELEFYAANTNKQRDTTREMCWSRCSWNAACPIKVAIVKYWLAGAGCNVTNVTLTHSCEVNSCDCVENNSQLWGNRVISCNWVMESWNCVMMSCNCERMLHKWQKLPFLP